MGLLTTNLLSYSIHLIGKGDLNVLFGMGWSMDNIRELQSLSSSEVQRMGERAPHLLKPQCIDNRLFETMLNAIKRETAELQLQDALLKAGAPASLMQEFFGWSTNQTATRRRLLNLPAQSGRPPVKTDNHEVHRHWHASASEPDIRKRLLMVAQATGLPLRSFAQCCLTWANAETVDNRTHKRR